MAARSTPTLDLVADAGRTRLALAAPRPEILALAREPVSATGVAARLGLPRQRVNYHVRQLARAGFLRRAGQRQRRGLREQLWVVTARAFVLAPGVLGPDGVSSATGGATAAAGPAGLLLLAAQLHHELGAVCREAAQDGCAVPVLALESELAFRTAAQRGAFARELTAAVTRLIAEHAEPSESNTTTRSRTARFRLVLGCYPIPAGESPS